jgi:hypothetical protein
LLEDLADRNVGRAGVSISRPQTNPYAAERIIIGVSQAREYDFRAAAPSYVTAIGAVGGFAVAVVALLLAEGHGTRCFRPDDCPMRPRTRAKWTI